MNFGPRFKLSLSNKKTLHLGFTKAGLNFVACFEDFPGQPRKAIPESYLKRQCKITQTSELKSHGLPKCKTGGINGSTDARYRKKIQIGG